MLYFIKNLSYFMKKEKIEALKIFRGPMVSPETTFYIRAVGINERMVPGIVNRPTGTGDWLLMYFHHPVNIKSVTGIAEHPAGRWIIWSDSDAQYYGRNDCEWVHSWVHFSGKSIAPMVADCGFKANEVMQLDTPDGLVDSLQPIYWEIIEQADPDRVILQNLFHNLLRRLSRRTGKSGIEQMPERIFKIKNLMEEHPSRRYTIPDLAKQASMSIPHFCAEFKKNVGVSPVEYHIRIRLQLARHLLYDRNLSISEIADRVGYNDIYHFSKQFKKHYGVSPRALRK